MTGLGLVCGKAASSWILSVGFMFDKKMGWHEYPQQRAEESSE
jgi:hypothetical protein